MTSKNVLVAAVAALLLGLPGSSQTPSDLLQKGIHAQEAAGDLDVAIAIFRQVVNSASNNKPLAAQAQYQLVLCMLQKGDRAAASKELSTLEHNFADMPDLVAKARKLIPATSALLPEPWGERECAQLDIKRAGVSTGEYLYYSADAWTHQAGKQSVENATLRGAQDEALLQSTVFRWELKTTNSMRSITVREDRDTMRPFEKIGYGNGIEFASDDDLGDPLAVPFAGPATDLEQSVFLIRRLPLAVGYKTTLPVTSNSYAPRQLELGVTGIETLATPAGKFNCYKVAFAAIGQTFWIGVEGARPLVKLQSGTVEAELVKVWGPENPLLDSLGAIAKAAGGKLDDSGVGPGKSTSTSVRLNDLLRLFVTSTNIRTPSAEIPRALEHVLAERQTREKGVVRPGSLRTRLIGGQQALSCLLDTKTETLYIVWIGTENAILELSAKMTPNQIGVFRWRFDPIIDAIRIP